MNLKKIAKIVAAIAALAAIGAAVYFLVKKLFPKKEVQYFDDSDFFECDDDVCEVIECDNEQPAEEAAPTAKEEAPAAEEAKGTAKAAKSAPKKKTAAKKEAAK